MLYRQFKPFTASSQTSQRPLAGRAAPLPTWPTLLTLPTLVLGTGLLLTCLGAAAAEYGTVVSSTPIISQVPSQQQQCYDEQQSVAPRNSGGGAVVGAVIGGLIGNSFGGGTGRAAMTGLGVLAGAAVGDRAESQGQPNGTAVVRRCQNVGSYEQRVTGYDVAYEYAGRRYNTRLDQALAAGTQIALDVNVAPAGSSSQAPVGPQGYAAPPTVNYYSEPAQQVYVQPPTTVYYSESVRPVYVAPPPPVVIYRRPYPQPYYRGGTNFQFQGDWNRGRDNPPPPVVDGRHWHNNGFNSSRD